MQTVVENNVGLKASDTDVFIEFVYDDTKGLKRSEVSYLQRRAFAKKHLERKEFKGARGSVLVQREVPRSYFVARGVSASSGTSDIIWVGLGARGELTRDALRNAATSAFRKVRELGHADVTVTLPAGREHVSDFEAAEIVTATAGLINYTLNHQKKAKLRYTPPKTISMLRLRSLTESSDVECGAAAGAAIADSVKLARDLSNEPAETCTPERLAREAQRIARDSDGTIKVTEFGLKSLKHILKAGGILAVNRGSELPPVLVHATYTPKNVTTEKSIAFVGKGITYDTGGINLKPPAGALYMKRDMSGAAVVLGVLEAIARLRLPIKVHVLFAATDNAIDAKSYKPGDVITTMSGITVENVNTDAEGRITLADVVWYAKYEKIDYLLDLATLTGAVKSIGGDVAAGAFSNNDEFLAMVDAAASAAGEKVQPMRMFEELRSLNDSTMADLKNSGGELAGSTTAAWFIREFVDHQKSVPWVHLDIAGVAFRNRVLGQDPAESTGWGVRTCVELTRMLSRNDKT